MAIDFYIKLVLAVYKVSELFPEREALKHDIRDLANEILVDLISNQNENTSRSIEILKDCFKLAEAENWVDSRNFSVLCREYDKIGKSIKKQAETFAGKTVEKPLITQNRKEKILEILKAKKTIQVKELIQDFPQVSKRTLIRDLEELYRTGTVLRIGNGRASCYSIKS